MSAPTLILDVNILAQEIFLRLVPTLIEIDKEKMVHQIANLALLSNVTAKVYVFGPKNLGEVQKEFEEAYALLELDV